MRNATQGDVNGLILDQVMEHWSNEEDVRVFVTDNGKNVESYRYTWTKPPAVEIAGPPLEPVKLGTVEPDYNNKLSEDNVAFIAGAIKKYGGNSAYNDSLVIYLNQQVNGRVLTNNE
jgi:hypothetical protein